ncbi:SGNH/GDSL hydrolase family protein [Amycolatopsis sp. NBC_01480]|uniref:SGNH/GDSL hydrolase family protein n=1 Tax=Amycolatopsis sp. NBC_01480 TaxID=2903562 RepID=UPI002E2B6FBD|nr:SGNH/GDSL hydrolase family protein [Amycolatopsis sp. NBC_01480]
MRRRHSTAFRTAALLLVTAGALSSCSTGPPPAPATDACGAAAPAGPVDTWTAAPARLSGPYQDKTIREVVHTSIGGTSVRLRLSNVFGTTAVRFDSVWAGAQSDGAGLVAGSNQRVRFGGAEATTVAAGAEEVSDPVDLTVRPGENLTVSIHVDGGTGDVTGHLRAQQHGWYADGDAGADPSAARYAHQVDRWFWLDAVTVQPSRPARTVVALGDSITDGFHSTVDANHRWPDYLAARLGPCGRFGVANEGIAGNRVTANGSGVSAEARLQRDVLAQPGTGTVIYLEGINDIDSTVKAADQLIQADQKIVARAHAAGLRVIGGTITPFDGFHTYSAATEGIRESVNSWIRDSKTFDAVADFDAALRDPADPHRLLGRYDSGDHLHPGDAGYQVMAGVVPLDALG